MGFSPDGKILASASRDQTIRLWAVETRQPRGQPLAGPQTAVTSIAFSPDGKILTLGSWNDTVILWEVEVRQKNHSLPVRPNTLAPSIAFSPSSRMLVAAGGNKAIVLWDITSIWHGEPQGPYKSFEERACSIANRNLTKAEWQNYLVGKYRKTCPNLPSPDL